MGKCLIVVLLLGTGVGILASVRGKEVGPCPSCPEAGRVLLVVLPCYVSGRVGCGDGIDGIEMSEDTFLGIRVT